MPEQVTVHEEILQVAEARPVPRARPAARTRRWLIAAACALVALALFAAYYRLSWTAPVNSDGAANVFQAWDMLHGNPLLHGWWLSDASFYTTELPQYVVLEAVLGQIPAVIHLAAAMTYTLAVVLAAVLAKGKAGGWQGALRMAITAGIMLAPQPGGGINIGGGTFVLDLSLGHIGTSVPLLAAWLVLDRAGARRWVPPVIGLLLAWVMVADALVLYVGVVPVVAVYGMRAYRDVVARRRPARSAWFEIAMVIAAAAAVPAAAGGSALLRAMGGFSLNPSHPVLVSETGLLRNVAVTFQSVLTLFGANFLGLRVGFPVEGALLHLTGLALAGWGVWLGLRRFTSSAGPGETVDEIMALAVAANLFAFVFSTLATDPSYAREIAVALPFSAALAGRTLPERLMRARLLPMLGVVLVGYMFTLLHGIVQLPATTQDQQLAQWLDARHLRYGLGGYWEASSVTLASGRRVQVRPIDAAPGSKTVGAYPWESDASWYNPALHYANFVITGPGGAQRLLTNTFGKPAQVYQVGPYDVLVWHKNLLAGLGCGLVYSQPTGTAATAAPACS